MRLAKKLGLFILVVSLFNDVLSLLLFSLLRGEEQQVEKTAENDKEKLEKTIADLEERLAKLEKASKRKSPACASPQADDKATVVLSNSKGRKKAWLKSQAIHVD